MPFQLRVQDLALIELLRGSTDAPDDVLRGLKREGFITFENGKPRLTPGGRGRAILAPAENALRLQASGQPLHAVAGPVAM